MEYPTTPAFAGRLVDKFANRLRLARHAGVVEVWSQIFVSPQFACYATASIPAVGLAASADHILRFAGPSSPCTMTSVIAVLRSGFQWQWRSTLGLRFDLKQPLLRRRQKVYVAGESFRQWSCRRHLTKGRRRWRRARQRNRAAAPSPWEEGEAPTHPARFVVGRDRLISCTYNDVFVAAADSTKTGDKLQIPPDWSDSCRFSNTLRSLWT